MASSNYGILFDYDWCTGCHSCEIACQMEHQYPVGQTGVLVFEVGPYKIADGELREDWQYGFQIGFTKQCDACIGRKELGLGPTCVKHCQAKCLSAGPIEEMLEKLKDKPKQALFSMVR